MGKKKKHSQNLWISPVLEAARKKLGMPHSSRVQLADVVSTELRIPRPISKIDQYRMLAKYVGVDPGNWKPKVVVFAQTDAFLLSWEWRTLRMKALVKWGPRCQCCGAEREDGVKIHVDHIKPRATHPELALDLDNLQILCEVCNQGKGSWDDTDWRPAAPVN